MKSTANKILALTLTALLASCAGQKPQGDAAKLATKPKSHGNTAMNYPSPRLPGQWTVEDVLQDFGTYAGRKLSPYFAKAKVPFPPREATFIFLKEEKKLELWARGEGEFRFIRDYDIQAASGVAGPKLRQGDRQVPEGIYRIVGLNPNSHYHLSMKLNYPNEFDRYHADQEGRLDPGGDIFIHGKAASIGCLAMGDEVIEELFVLTAQTGKENIKVVIAPHDPRLSPLDTEAGDLPEWTPELYESISHEIRALSPTVSVSDNRLATQPNPLSNQ